MAVLNVDPNDILKVRLAVKEVAFQVVVICRHVVEATDKIVATRAFMDQMRRSRGAVDQTHFSQ